jgi:SNF2 family DNA or RNA helicase
VDIFSQYRFLDSSVFGTSFYAFRNKYAIMGGFDKHQIVGYREMDDLIQKEHSIAYRVTKSEALDLPEQTFENRYIQLSDADRKVYDQLKRDSYAELESGGEITAPTVLTKLLRLQQLTGGFLRLDDTDKPKQVNHAKLDALMEIVNDCVDANQKVVVFARFVAEIDLIADTLRKAGIQFGMIDGRTPNEHRTDRTTGQEIMSRSEIVEDFQTNPKTTVFLAQIQTAGLGITLHAASIAVFYSLDFNMANYTQATARIHRIGQHHPCTYIPLLVEKSVDEKVMKALATKQDLAKQIVDNWKTVFEEV